MIKVAFGSVPKDGGTFTFYRNLRPALLEHGIDMRCVSVGKDQASLTEARFVDEGCVQLAADTHDLKRQARVFVDWCVEADIDIAFGVNSPAILSALPHLPEKVRVMARCANGFDEGYKLTLMGQERLARIVALVPRLRDDLMRSYGVAPSKLILIPNGTSPERFTEAAAMPRGEKDALRLGFLGRLEHNQKGVMHIPPILERLDAEGVPYELKIAGKGKHEQELREALGPKIQTGQVTFVGTLAPDEIPAFLGQCDVFLFPSHFEGCPNALLEAMMAGAVPVSWRLEGITDFLLTAGETGFLAETGDTDSFGEAIAALARDRTKLAAVNKAAAEEARDRFSTHTCAEAYVRLLNEVMDSDPPAFQPRPWSDFTVDPMFRQNPLARFIPQEQRQMVRSVLRRLDPRKTQTAISPMPGSAPAHLSKHPRVHQIINSFAKDRGGAERVARDLHLGLRAEGVDARLVALEACPTDDLEAAMSLDLTSPYDPRALLRLAAYAKNIREDDIVHVHLFPTSAHAAMLARSGRLRGRIVFTEHSTSNRRRTTVLGGQIDNQVYRAFDKIIAISAGVEKELLKARPWLRGRTHVVENGCRLPFDTPPARDHNGPVRITSVGRLIPAKNYVNALKAVAGLKGHDIHYTIAGDGPLRSELENIIQDLSLSSHVTLQGFVEDVPDLLVKSDLFFIPSQWEGFGLAAVEAMNAGLPVVASDISGLGDVIGAEGEAALRIDPNDVAGMTRALETLVVDPERRARMGAKGFVRSQNYSIDRFVDAHLALYETLSGSPQHAA